MLALHERRPSGKTLSVCVRASDSAKQQTPPCQPVSKITAAIRSPTARCQILATPVQFASGLLGCQTPCHLSTRNK